MTLTAAAATTTRTTLKGKVNDFVISSFYCKQTLNVCSQGTGTSPEKYVWHSTDTETLQQCDLNAQLWLGWNHFYFCCCCCCFVRNYLLIKEGRKLKYPKERRDDEWEKFVTNIHAYWHPEPHNWKMLGRSQALTSFISIGDKHYVTGDPSWCDVIRFLFEDTVHACIVAM